MGSFFHNHNNHIDTDDDSRQPSNYPEADSDMESVASLPPFSPVASSSVTSNELDDMESIRSFMTSPAPSVFSMTSSLRQQSFRQVYGRAFNSYSEVYNLPADEEEIGRLDKQHVLLSAVMGGVWVPPVPEVLAPELGVTKAVLDLGCGSGAWIMDVARAFPDCSTVGVDLVPIQATSLPPNCRFEVDDINLGLEHFHGSFDIVRTRLISSGVKDYAGLIDQMARCLRPRGLIEVTEYDFRVYYPDKTLFAPWSTTRPREQAPYLCRWFHSVSRAVRMRGGHIDAAALLHLWIRQHGSFAEEEIVYREFWCPTGPLNYANEWGGQDKYSRELGEMMRDDIQTFLRGGRTLLLDSGMSDEEVDELERGAHRELDESSYPMFVKLQCVYARKKAMR